MGHTRLGTVPKLRKWDDIVTRFAAELPASVSETAVAVVARHTLLSAEPALLKAVDDRGLRAAFLLLAKTVLASREPSFDEALSIIGVQLPADASVFDLTSELHAAIDEAVFVTGRSTDASEMAQRALGEALTELVSAHTTTLFEPSPDDLKAAVRGLSTRRGFGQLGQRFFGYFLARFLNSYLSRIAAAELGGVVRHVGDLTTFNNLLRSHCVESAAIVRDFCGEWYSKSAYREGINELNSARFVAVAVKKLAAELKRQGAIE